MKGRSSSPLHVHVDDLTPVHVHVKRSRSFPSSVEQVPSVAKGVSDLTGRGGREKQASEGPVHTSQIGKEEKALRKSSITPTQADRICSLIHSSDVDVDHGDARAEKTGEPWDHISDIGFESPQGESSLEDHSLEVAGSRATRDDCALLPGGQQYRIVNRLQLSSYLKPSDLEQSSYDETVGKKRLLKTLIEAETAANSAAIQLVSFKDILTHDDSRLPACSRRLSRQKNLLLEKLEVFKSINKSVRQQLKEMHSYEAHRLENEQDIDILLRKVTQTEAENLHLKRSLSEKERRVEELMHLRRKEMENVESVVQLSKSVEVTRAHLQGQLRNKEAENNRLTVQLRSLERTLTEAKLEIESLKQQMLTLSEKSAQEKEALKKATRAQKQRAERFEAAIEKCYSQLKEKDVRLAEASSQASCWKTQHEQALEEKTHVEAHVAILRSQVADMTLQLQRERDAARASCEDLLERVEKLNADRGEMSLENAALKATIADLEEKVTQSQVDLEKESTNSQKQKELAEQYQNEITGLQKEVEELRSRFESLQKENELFREGKEAELEKVKEELEARVKELEMYPDLLSAAEQKLQDCQENLLRSERSISSKSESLRQLQLKVDKHADQLTSSLDMKGSIDEANVQLQLKVESLQRKMEEIQLENKELVHKLASQEEALQYSSSQLEQRSAECLSLTRQLEAALADVRQQVSKVKEKASTKERSFQTKILELETERSRLENELKQLKQNKQAAEKHYEIRLKDLQLSLNQSESHKQSIQNYVDFLKNSYATMFEDGFPTNFERTSYLKCCTLADCCFITQMWEKTCESELE
ncbi:outer dense fiber protein 2-like isoform X1 [Scleropages formosus]|uniref:outer dense fiber protein 2-like isoform X1 n=1 Tax=Scleropages formosus TaxID=113540 RepID=UPI0010FAAD45|nr:outer dense fiber protein 2-like isoform X1 [Scleropages formosus]